MFDQPIDVCGELTVEAPDKTSAAVVGHECLLHWPHRTVCCVVVSSVLLAELFDVFIWNFSCMLVDQFTLLSLGLSAQISISSSQSSPSA